MSFAATATYLREDRKHTAHNTTEYTLPHALTPGPPLIPQAWHLGVEEAREVADRRAGRTPVTQHKPYDCLKATYSKPQPQTSPSAQPTDPAQPEQAKTSPALAGQQQQQLNRVVKVRRAGSSASALAKARRGAAGPKAPSGAAVAKAGGAKAATGEKAEAAAASRLLNAFMVVVVVVMLHHAAGWLCQRSAASCCWMCQCCAS